MSSTPGCKLVVVAPVQITDARLVSSDVPEDDYPVWAAGTYAKGARVIVLSNHSVYESAADGNTDNPLTPSAEPKWVRVGPTNRWRMFDESIGSQTAQADQMTYVLQPGTAVTRLTLLNLTDALTVRVQVTDAALPGSYDRTVTLGRQLGLASWWNYFFGRRSVPTQADFDDLPGFTNPTITVTIAGGAALAVGVLLLGQAQTWGLGVRIGARVGIQDYSRKDVDAFGNIVLVRRGYAKKAHFSMIVPHGEVDALQNLMASVRSTPCLWIASDAYEATTIYGYYWNFELMLSYKDYAEFDLELRGLT